MANEVKTKIDEDLELCEDIDEVDYNEDEAVNCGGVAEIEHSEDEENEDIDVDA